MWACGCLVNRFVRDSKDRIQETEATAGLDNDGLVKQQELMIRQQDAELDDLAQTVQSTKHISLAINDELTLQDRLLDDLDDSELISPPPFSLFLLRRARARQKRSGN